MALASEETLARLAPGGATVVSSTALEGGHVLKASAGRLYSLRVRIDSTLATGTYYIQGHNAASAPADGTNAFIFAPVKVQHISGLDDYFEDERPSGLVTSTGIYACISSTEFTKTLVASAGTFEGTVV